jgi:hypothetical protein
MSHTPVVKKTGLYSIMGSGKAQMLSSKYGNQCLSHMLQYYRPQSSPAHRIMEKTLLTGKMNFSIFFPTESNVL